MTEYNAEYKALHKWVRKVKPRPDYCELCNVKPSREVANVSGEYKWDINDFQWLCHKCHMETDIRAKIKNREAHVGKKASDATKLKMHNAGLGNSRALGKHWSLTDATKQKMCEAAKKREALKKQKRVEAIG